MGQGFGNGHVPYDICHVPCCLQEWPIGTYIRIECLSDSLSIFNGDWSYQIGLEGLEDFT